MLFRLIHSKCKTIKYRHHFEQNEQNWTKRTSDNRKNRSRKNTRTANGTKHSLVSFSVARARRLKIVRITHTSTRTFGFGIQIKLAQKDMQKFIGFKWLKHTQRMRQTHKIRTTTNKAEKVANVAKTYLQLKRNRKCCCCSCYSIDALISAQ